MPIDLLHAVAELCCALEQVTTPTEAKAILRQAVDAFGADFFLFGLRSGTNIQPPQQLVVSTYPQRWQRAYDSMGAVSFDPVLNKALQFKGPFRWDGLHATPKQLALRQESERCGMTYGITTSDRGPDAGLAILSFSGARPIATGDGEWPRAAAALSLLASTTHKAFARELHARFDPGEPLRDVEIRCLTLLAGGAVAHEAAQELGVSPRTVRYYLESVSTKLGVETHKEALAAAIARGLIDTRKFPPLAFGSAGTI